MYINGNHLIKVHDETYSNGALTLYGAYTGHETGEIRFDNFEVKRITSGLARTSD
ncbi:hypothetical protein [Desulforegula conservatrix]|uniref:hypothetical protein n=1 Tax=Desulforegula conservatrix TaxID=153026 RepID=UPI000429577A|nr:hypothetical protein [Desulforegula conservatrix]